MNDDIKVTVWCLAYNHEKYIRMALEGFVSQKTNFKYEVIVHDDASTDKTADIIREYEEKYPDIIKPIYQTENQFQKRVNKISNFLLPNAKGKYIAYCEGDDYWSSPLKLQKQVDILENNKNCALCLHKTEIISENGEFTGNSFPRYDKIKNGILESNEFLSLVLYTRTLLYLQFQITGLMIKKCNLEKYSVNKPYYASISDVGDLPLFLYMGTLGDAFYIDEAMSCYRASALGSWNMRNNCTEKRIRHLNIECEVLREFDKYYDYRVTDSVNKGILNREFGIHIINNDVKKIKKLEYKEFYKMLSVKEKIIIHMKKYVPFLYNFLKKCKS